MKKCISCLLALVVSVCALSGCSNSKHSHIAALPVDLLEDSSYSLKLKSAKGYTKVMSNDRLAFYVNGETADFFVQDLKTGKRWYSSAQGPDANGNTHSQIQLSYANSASQISTLNSYTDGVQLSQFSWTAAKDGIKVTYDIGKRKKTRLIPQVITKSRMEKTIFANLSEDDRKSVEEMYTLNSLKTVESSVLGEDLIKKYPMIKHQDVYVVYDNLADFAADELEKMIRSAGYSMDDLEQDNKENGIVNVDQSICFRVPVEYKLEDDSLVARVVSKEIVTPNNATLLTMDFLPFFGSADEQKKGYMFVPDGCGALINLNNGKQTQGSCLVPLYGHDAATQETDVLTQKQKCSLPVYGMKQDEDAFVAIIEKGAAVASINAAVSGTTNAFNYIYPSFVLNAFEKADVPYGESTSMYFYQKKMTSSDLQLRFCFLQKDEADYSGMARRYQKYLTKQGTLKAKTEYKPAVYVTLLGAIDKKENVAGIPITRAVPLTTFSNAEEIVKTLRGKGVDSVVVRYLGWSNGGLQHSPMTSLKILNQLGGKKQQQQFQNYMKDCGNRVYWDVDLQTVYKDSLFDGYNNAINSPKTINGRPASLHTYDHVTEQVKDNIPLVSPERYLGAAQKASKSLKAFSGQDVSLGDMANLLYSDFDNGKFLDREGASNQIANTFDLFGKSGKVLGVQPASYVLSSLSEAVDVPGDTNGYYFYDEEVPFYQMVIHGYLPYSGEPANTGNNFDQSVLQMVEFGAMPGFKWMYQTNDFLYDIKTDYCSVSYREWVDNAADSYAKVSKALQGVYNQAIVSHSRRNNVSCTAYENGTKIYVNYNTVPSTCDGKTIAARGYLVCKGGEQP